MVSLRLKIIAEREASKKEKECYAHSFSKIET
jgi:uncharacterized DUF497 family protein